MSTERNPSLSRALQGQAKLRLVRLANSTNMWPTPGSQSELLAPVGAYNLLFCVIIMFTSLFKDIVDQRRNLLMEDRYTGLCGSHSDLSVAFQHQLRLRRRSLLVCFLRGELGCPAYNLAVVAFDNRVNSVVE